MKHNIRRLVKYVWQNISICLIDNKFLTFSTSNTPYFLQILSYKATFLSAVAGIITWILTWLNPLRAEVCKSEVGIYDLQINLWQSFGALMQQGTVVLNPLNSFTIKIGLNLKQVFKHKVVVYNI